MLGLHASAGKGRSGVLYLSADRSALKLHADVETETFKQKRFRMICRGYEETEASRIVGRQGNRNV